MSLSERYFKRFGIYRPLIENPPLLDLALVVVIPCCNEPELIGALNSLFLCQRPGCAAEVIVVINSSELSPPNIQRQNAISFEEGSRWAETHADARLRFHFLHFPNLPAKTAGVGLARKIGLDQAIWRLAAVSRTDCGVLASYDSDCACDPNYLTALETHFAENPQTPACSIYFEHPLDGLLAREVYAAIALYELHLRFYNQALRYAGYPYAFHTVGSAMAIRAETYLKQGGMNKRQAGEDFHFLHKIIPLGGFTDLTTTRVVPSPRVSDRVPFGTGKAMGNALGGELLTTYPLEGFLDLQRLIGLLPALWQSRGTSAILRDLPVGLKQFLTRHGLDQVVQECLDHTASQESFQKRFWGWLNGFLVMKFLNCAKASYGAQPVASEASRLLKLREPQLSQSQSVSELLDCYRRLDRNRIPLQRGEG